MESSKQFLINSTILFITTVSLIVCQSEIFFQETDLLQAAGTHNVNRKPIYKPDVCAQNELLYPGDRDDDWVCDCIPGYVYHPDYDQCYALYRKEPCENSEYLTLSKSKIPECTRNPCPKENYVQFRGRCYELGKRGPCRNRVTAEIVEVNETTLEIGCVAQRRSIIQSSMLQSRFGDALELKKCTKGTKKNMNICENEDIQYWMSPETCGNDKVLYKIPQQDDRICDCKPGYIYHSATDACYQSHSKGPCTETEKFVLQGDTGICQNNECSVGQVQFNNQCVELGKASALCPNKQNIGVDDVTYELKCTVEKQAENPGQFLVDAPICAKGGKRDKENKC